VRSRAGAAGTRRLSHSEPPKASLAAASAARRARDGPRRGPRRAPPCRAAW
jgi:hypothetical protein